MKLIWFLLAQLSVAQNPDHKNVEQDNKKSEVSEDKSPEDADPTNLEGAGEEGAEEDNDNEIPGTGSGRSAAQWHQKIVNSIWKGKKPSKDVQREGVICAQRCIEMAETPIMGYLVQVVKGETKSIECRFETVKETQDLKLMVSFKVPTVMEVLKPMRGHGTCQTDCQPCTTRTLDFGANGVKLQETKGHCFLGICSTGRRPACLPGMSEFLGVAVQSYTAIKTMSVSAKRLQVLSTSEFGNLVKYHKQQEKLPLDPVKYMQLWDRFDSSILHLYRTQYLVGIDSVARQGAQLSWFPDVHLKAAIRGVSVDNVCGQYGFFGCPETSTDNCVQSTMERIFYVGKKAQLKGKTCAPIPSYSEKNVQVVKLRETLQLSLEAHIQGFEFGGLHYPYEIFVLDAFPNLFLGEAKKESVEFTVEYHQTLNTALYGFFSAFGEMTSWTEVTQSLSQRRQFTDKISIDFFQMFFGKIEALKLNLNVREVMLVLADWCKLEPRIESGSKSIGAYQLSTQGKINVATSMQSTKTEVQSNQQEVQTKVTTTFHSYEIEYREKLIENMASYCADIYPQDGYMLNLGSGLVVSGSPVRLLDGASGVYDDLEAKLYNGAVIPNAHKVGKVVLQPGCSWITPALDEYETVKKYYSYTRQVEGHASPFLSYSSSKQVTVTSTEKKLKPKPYNCKCAPTYTVAYEEIVKAYETSVTTYTNFKIPPPQKCIVWTLSTNVNVGIKISQESIFKELKHQKVGLFQSHQVEMTFAAKSSVKVETFGLVAGGPSIIVFSPCFKRVNVVSSKATTCASACGLVKTGVLQILKSEQLVVNYLITEDGVKESSIVMHGHFEAAYLGKPYTLESPDADAGEEEEQTGHAASFFVALAALLI